MSLDPPAYILSLQNNIRARPISWEGAVRARTITDADLKRIKSIDKVRKEQRKQTIESDLDGFAQLLLGGADAQSIFQAAAKRQDIIQNLDVPSFVQTLTRHPNPYQPLLPFLTQSSNPEEPIPLLTSSVLSSLISQGLAASNKTPAHVDEALPKLFSYLSTLARSSDSGLQDIAVQEYSALLKTRASRELYWSQRKETLNPLIEILRAAAGTTSSGDTTPMNGNASVRSLGTDTGLAGGVGIQLLYHVLLVIWQLTFEGDLVGQGLDEEHDIVPLCAQLLRVSPKEKISRVLLAILNNLLTSNNQTLLPAAIQARLPSLLANVKGRHINDEEFLGDLDSLKAMLEDYSKSQTTFDEYAAEVRSGHLRWSPPHRKPEFWKENARKILEENKGELAKKLAEILSKSWESDRQVLAIGCNDVACLIKEVPEKKGALEKAGLKARVMELMQAPEETIRYESLRATGEWLSPCEEAEYYTCLFQPRPALSSDCGGWRLEAYRALRNRIGRALAKPEIREQLVERLRALELRSQQRQRKTQKGTLMEKGYVFVEDNNVARRPAPPAYEHPSQEISVTTIERWEKEVLEDPKVRHTLCAAKISDSQTFNISIPHEGAPVTNQRSSGRCWLFASTNVFRIALMKKHKLKEFELSQAYLFFWDKLEKANYFLENVLDTVDEPLDGRILQTLMQSPVGDGGQWDMVANLVNKYGLVPQTLYPDSFNAMNSSAMGSLITTKLREDALRLREQAKSNEKSSLAATKSAMMREIHLILTLMLGPPPSPKETFDWEFYDRDGKLHKLSTSPLAFSQELSSSTAMRLCGGTDVHQLFSLVHDPRNEYETLLSVERLGNVWGALPIRYVNVKMSTLKKACIQMLRKGMPVFFGSDVGKFSDSARGIMDTALFDYELGFNVRLGMSKAERLMTGESAMTHAMVLTGVHVEDGQDVRWRVENSWSETAGDKGYFVMSAAWMDEFVYQAVVDPSCVASELKNILKSEPTVLPPWDPMGALA
ncbi:hypothetical protein FH972_023472 [Carpinus fangiana]|uniref:Bleomycin hydrolase n=1 Tax=Carpinus fangiana TaxID=176857 RepID=A0A5N6KV99_9ROSI|nr:hypothetical protein FH972_023472 [Carpinus fangiana]